MQRNPITDGQPATPVPFDKMEEALSRELASERIMDERLQREKDRLFANSDQIKEMQMRITAAIMNKERSAQISEAQYRNQLDLVSACQW